MCELTLVNLCGLEPLILDGGSTQPPAAGGPTSGDAVLRGGALHAGAAGADGGERAGQVPAAPRHRRRVERRRQPDAFAAGYLVQGAAGDTCDRMDGLQDLRGGLG